MTSTRRAIDAINLVRNGDLIMPQPLLIMPQPLLIMPQPLLIMPQPLLIMPQPLLIMPQPLLNDALTELERVSALTGHSIEHILKEYDPDPRIGSREYSSLQDMLSDLDERERYRAVRCVHTMVARCRDRLAEDIDLLPALWAIAHDRAIVEAEHA